MSSEAWASDSGSTAPGSWIVSRIEIWLPPSGSAKVHRSSRASTEELAICSSTSWNSSTVISSFSAISSSVGARWSLASSFWWAFSTSRARARTERGTQSSERSSSMIAPLIRATAKVSNLISRSVSKRSIAPISPSRP